MIDWSAATYAVTAAFLGSFVEVVEAFTIILAVGTVRGWRPALIGTAAGLGVLFLLVLVLGPMFSAIPLRVLQLVIGILLLLFGMRWLRKAILRAAGIIPLHDEELAFAAETGQLRASAGKGAERADFLAMATVFKAVVLEGVEVVFIVLAVGAGHGLLLPASLGALGACILVLLIGIAVHKPLSAVPENTLKFVVGIMLSSFGTFWVLEGLGGGWFGSDLAILVLGAGFGFSGIVTARLVREGRKSAVGASA